MVKSRILHICLQSLYKLPPPEVLKTCLPPLELAPDVMVTARSPKPFCPPGWSVLRATRESAGARGGSSSPGVTKMFSHVFFQQFGSVRVHT